MRYCAFRNKKKKKHASAIPILTVGLAGSAELNTKHHHIRRGGRQHANLSQALIEQLWLTYREWAWHKDSTSWRIS